MSDFKDEFHRIVESKITRDGIKPFMEWLDSTDFFTAPASTRYHGDFEGGLVQHSLNVFTQLKQLAEVYELSMADGIMNVIESVALVALFHDVCKAGCYKKEMRWRKNEKQQWEQYPIYTFKEDFAYGGHGSKSVFLIQSFMKLTPEEASAINCHMGAWDSTTYSNPSEVFCRNKLAWLLHVADEAASYLVDNKKEE